MTNHREFYVMFNGTYPNVPRAKLRKSNYVDLPSSNYDSLDGQQVLAKMLDGLQSVERLGFDGALFSEQHNGPIGLLGNPMLLGAWLAARTERIKIGVAGPILNGYLSPIRLAEEIALLDQLAHGRLIVGLPFGHGAQYHSVGMVNPATARARYQEAHDLLMKALTHEGPFEWIGEFYQVPYVNLWPRPVQRPTPNILVLGGGSPDTLELVARNRHAYQPVGVSSREQILATRAKLAAATERHGYELQSSQVWNGFTFHVAETDARAHAEAEPFYHWMMQNFMDSAFEDTFPPGYLSERALGGLLGGESYRSKQPSAVSYREAVDKGNLIVGSPSTVRDQLTERLNEYGTGRAVLNTNQDIKPAWLGNKSLQIFAEEVLPHLWGDRHAPAEPPQPDFRSVAEYSALRDRSRPRPTIERDGEVIDVYSTVQDF